MMVSREAVNDLADITDYISRDNPVRALSFAEELEAHFTEICKRPLSFSPRPEWGKGRHSAIYGRYVIIFHVHSDQIKILRVVHGARDIDELFA
jgi:toxin ParE1/3/4